MTPATITRRARAPHVVAAAAVLDTLTLSDTQAFVGLFVILRARLTPQERKALAWAAMMACNDEEALAVAKAVIPPEERAGSPMVPWPDVAEAASFWADHASPGELRACAHACLARLSQAKRRAA